MDHVKQYFNRIVQDAKESPLEIELLIHESENLKLSYQKRKLDKFEKSMDGVAGFRVIYQGGTGYSFTENLNFDSLKQCFQEAFSNAKVLVQHNKHSSNILPGLFHLVKAVKTFATPSLPNLFVPQEVVMREKLNIAEALESEALALDPRVTLVPYNEFNETKSVRRVLNSHGLDLSFSQNYYSGYIYALVTQSTQSKMNGESFFERDFCNINPASVAKQAVKKAIAQLGATELRTGTYPILIDRNVMPTIMSMLLSHLSAQSVIDDKSLLKNKIDHQVASVVFSLIDDPFDLRGSGVRPFDSEGFSSQKTSLIENGILKTYLTNSETARKLNLKNTGHASRLPTTKMGIGPSNFIVKAGHDTREGLLKSYPKLVLLTQINGGLHAGYKESTGDFSLPCEGFLFESGEDRGPKDQFVLSGNILQLLKNIEALGRDYNHTGNSLLAPDILVRSLSVAGA